MLNNNEKYNRSAYGRFMYNFTVKAALFLNKHLWLYWLLALTWGIIMTLIGYIVAFVLIMLDILPIKYNQVSYFELGKEPWGGVSLGMIFIRDTNERDISIEPHEYGHTFQNAVLGPLFPFLVAIPSAIRYWYQVIREKKGLKNKPYDCIWFEGSATDIGELIEKGE